MVFQGTINSKNLRQNRVSPSDAGATILDKNYETNVCFHKKMNCFYTCPFPPHSMLTKLHRVVSLTFNIDKRGKGG